MHSDAIVFYYNNGKRTGWFKISEANGTEAQEVRALHGIKVWLVKQKIPLFCPA